MDLYFPRDRVKVMLLLLIIAVIYLPFINNPLVFDDVPFFSGVSSFADQEFNFIFRWFPHTSFGFTWVFFGEDPPIYRVQNLLLHGMNVLLLLLLLRLWISLFVAEADKEKIANWGAWLGALVFACHPLAVYGVGYLAQRSILMATLFTLVMHLAYFRSLLGGDKRYALLAVAAYFLAVFSKEHSLLAPAILLPLTWVLRAQIKLSRRGLLLTWLGFAAIAMIVLMRTKGILGQAYEKDAATLLEQDGLLEGMPMAHLLSILTQAGLFFKYCLLILVPNPAWMSIDMREPFLMDWHAWQSWSGIVVYLAYGAGALWCLLRGGRISLLGLALLYPWCLYPVEFSSVRVQEIFVLYRSYLWLPGYMLLLPLLVSVLPSKKMISDDLSGQESSVGASPARELQKPSHAGHTPSVNGDSSRLMLIGALIALLLVPLAWNRLAVFSDTYRLWDDAVTLLHGEDKLGSHRTYFNRAQASAEHKDWEAAIADYRKSLAINSSYPEVNVLLGAALVNAKRFQESILEFDKAIAMQPDFARAYYTKAYALKNLHDDAGAMQQMKKSCELGLQQACIIAAIAPQIHR